MMPRNTKNENGEDWTETLYQLVMSIDRFSADLARSLDAQNETLKRIAKRLEELEFAD